MQNLMASEDTMKKPVLSRGLEEVLKDLEGSVYFAKRLGATNALREPSGSRRYGQLAIPRWFICTHGNKFQRAVELRSDLTSNKPWPHRLSFCPSRGVPEVSFAGKAWVTFLISHALVKGDQVVFSLTAMSKFQVYIFNSLSDPKGPQFIHTPMRWSETNQQPQKLVTHDKCEDEKSGPATHARKKAKIDDEYVGGPSNDNAIPNSFLNDAHVQSRNYLSKSIPCLPSFLRRLGAINVRRMEIPRGFVAAHHGQLHDLVQLQGIHAHSPVVNVRCVCYSDNGLHSFFLQGTHWMDFVRENELCFGQELVFTLTTNSYFIVKREISWSPKHGLKLESCTPMIVKKEGAP